MAHFFALLLAVFQALRRRRHRRRRSTRAGYRVRDAAGGAAGL